MLMKHEVEHVECAQCGETLKNKTKLRNHEILTCLVKFKCDFCGEEFGLLLIKMFTTGSSNVMSRNAVSKLKLKQSYRTT